LGRRGGEGGKKSKGVKPISPPLLTRCSKRRGGGKKKKKKRKGRAVGKKKKKKEKKRNLSGNSFPSS